MEIAIVETEKYHQTAMLVFTSNAGDDVTDQIIRIIEGTEKNPFVQVRVHLIEGKGGGNKPSEYLQMKDSGRIKLVQVNHTNQTVYEHVHLMFTVGISSTSKRIDVSIPSQPVADEKTKKEMAIAESEKYHKTATITDATKIGEEVTDQVIRMIQGNEKNPIVGIKVHQIEGAGGGNKPLEYFQVDETGRITVTKMNTTAYPVTEHVHVWFTVDNATAGLRIDVTMNPTTQGN